MQYQSVLVLSRCLESLLNLCSEVPQTVRWETALPVLCVAAAIQGNWTHTSRWAPASAKVAPSIAAPVCSIAAAFHRDSIWTSDICCFCTLKGQKKGSQGGVRKEQPATGRRQNRKGLFCINSKLWWFLSPAQGKRRFVISNPLTKGYHHELRWD